MKNLLFALALPLVFFSCSDDKNGSSNKTFMQAAKGEADEIIIVIDSSHWSGELGQMLRSTFREPIKGMPQDEPKFRINKASPLKLNDVLKSAANMIFVMTLDNNSRESKSIRNYFTDQSLKIIRDDSTRFMLTREDEFAKGQTVMYLFGNTEDGLIDRLDENKERLQSYFETRAVDKIKKQLLKSRNQQAENAIKDELGVSVKVPFGWDIAKQLPNFVWFRLLDVDWEQNIFIYKEPYTTEKVFEDVAVFRDKITESYLRDSQKENLYITRQDRDDLKTVFYEQVNFNGMYGVRQRGLWKISNNSAGGPYISYTVIDEDTQTLYYIEGYVYAPGNKKKNLIREVDAVLNTFEPEK